MIEQTLSIIKPDAVERNLDNEIKSFFEKNNLKILKSKKVKISKGEASDFYKIHQTKPFYNDLCNYLSSGPIVVMVLEGENAIMKNRKLSYLGSSLHFMRSLYKKKLEENNFKIFYERFQVPTYKYFDIVQNKNMIQVELLVDEIAIF